MAILIKFLGFVLSKVPFNLLEPMVEFLGTTFMAIPSRRRSLLVSNLSYAFPGWSKEKRLSCARESASRMIEMGVFSLIYPFLSNDCRRSAVFIDQETEIELQKLRDSKRPVLFLLPHVSLFETLALTKGFRPHLPKKLGAIFRPNRNPDLNDFIDRSRRATGLVTFSRKEGLLKAKSFLREKNWLVVLFDQNAGDRGVLDLFFDRLISYTSLPDSLIRATGAKPIFAFPKRISFFKTQLKLCEIDASNSQAIASNAHQVLENLIKGDERGLPEWLWSHGKWKVHSRVESRYQWIVKRKHVIQGKSVPRRTNFFIRMPNWLGDIIMAVPVILAIRKGRPDVRFTLVCNQQYVPLLKRLSLGEEFLSLPEKSLSYFGEFKKRAKVVPDNYLLFTNFLRGDIEALITGSRQRFGMCMPGRYRPLLTHSYKVRNFKDATNPVHQTLIWEEMAKHFGLQEKIDRAPVRIGNDEKQSLKIGIVAGSSNSPNKRWSVSNWVKLVEKLSSRNKRLSFFLYGTANDLLITEKIESAVQSANVMNMAGETSLDELLDELGSCCCVIGNDTGSLHLANLLGTPIIVLFGPTNKGVTSPFFDAPRVFIHPEKGNNIDSITANEVLNKAGSFI